MASYFQLLFLPFLAMLNVNGSPTYLFAFDSNSPFLLSTFQDNQIIRGFDSVKKISKVIEHILS